MSAAETYLVHGPPGTGKTRYLAQQAERAAATHDAGSVAICSLTKTAAHEIAGRTRLSEQNVGTLHSCCYHALNQPDLAETGKSLKEFSERHPQLAHCAAGQQLQDSPIDGERAGRDGERYGRCAGQNLHNQVMSHRAALTDPKHWTEDQLNYTAHWENFKTQTGRLDFCDLIEQSIHKQGPHPAAPRVLLLDEAQDFSALELKLAAQWAEHTKTTVLAHDVDQALYQWRGASPQALIALQNNGQRVLSQSYRVPQKIHKLACDWIRRIEDRVDVDYQPTPQPGALQQSPASIEDPARLVEVLEQQLAGHDGDVMLLTSCAYMLDPILRELRQAGIPFANPHRERAGNWNPMRAAGAITAFLRPDERVWGRQARNWTWQDLETWTTPLKAGHLARGAKAAIQAHCLADRFNENRGAQEVALDTLLELLGATDLKHPAIRLDTNWWQQSLLSSHQERQRYPLCVYRRRGAQALREQSRLIVGTVHSVKGAESDCVVLAPDLSRSGMWQAWHGSTAARAQIIRLGYVALTRARATLCLLTAAGPERMPISEHLP